MALSLSVSCAVRNVEKINQRPSSSQLSTTFHLTTNLQCFLGCTACMLFVIMIATCTIGFWMLISATLKEHTQDLVVYMETTPEPNTTKVT
ncbi:hypothetical protein Y032_0009g803 [Ancylostoma ceylanicum]|uniref:Uncharacterized protein n=1 Tax=Ancylostoma ceylanicum TaxID=53326 RepID=A0A016VLG1_9BILA|nr:hypothetical protein Y032_0009g803 [Ancylostoma ceylanicum]